MAWCGVVFGESFLFGLSKERGVRLVWFFIGSFGFHRKVMACGLALGCLFLVGCTATQNQPVATQGGPTVSTPTVNPTWVEPGWMAQVRQENEEYQAGQIACYAEYGFTAVATMAGGVGEWNVPTDPGTQALLQAAADDCNARFPPPAYQDDKTLTAAAYGKMLDTRNCIIAHGYTVPEPPSQETWMDSDVNSAWNPYTYVNPVSTDAGQDALDALVQACPQPGPNYVSYEIPPASLQPLPSSGASGGNGG